MVVVAALVHDGELVHDALKVVQAGLELREGMAVADAEVLLHDTDRGVLLAHPHEAHELLAPGDGGALAAVLHEDVLHDISRDTNSRERVCTTVVESKHESLSGK